MIPLAVLALLALLGPTPQAAFAQDPSTRAGEWAAQQAKKAETPTPPPVDRAETFINNLEEGLLEGRVRWHPFFDNAYAGGGFTVGFGRGYHVSSYNIFDIRGSVTPRGYVRVEAEFLAPRLFDRRATLSAIGGWRQATQVGFYGFGADTKREDRANYGFQQPYGSALLHVRPTRGALVLGAGLEFSQWQMREGHGDYPSVDEVYTPETLPGLGASTTYVHSQASVGLDWRTAPDYSRRGGVYSATFHAFSDPDGLYSFRQLDYLAAQHIPILRETWVLSLRAQVRSTEVDGDQELPFFMMPALGGGSTMRGFASWRFRDRHSMLLTAEWRAIVNRYLDLALFYDAGKVGSVIEDLTTGTLESTVGVGVRFHGPATTPLRIEVARSREQWKTVFAAKASF